jgi:hypothetical protein
MIHKATVPPRQRGFIAARGEWKSHRHPDGSLLSLRQPGKVDSKRPDQLTRESRFCCSASFLARGEAGNCSTVACWPSHSRASRTIFPSGNSSASWCTDACSMLTFRNRANLSATFWFGKRACRYSTSCSNAISVPGRTHTATFGSPTAANPRVIVLSNLVDINLSPILAGRDATKSRL